MNHVNDSNQGLHGTNKTRVESSGALRTSSSQTLLAALGKS